MRSIETALAVDFARRGALGIPLALLASLAFTLWIFGSLVHGSAVDPLSKEAVILHVTLTLCMGFGAAVAVLQAQGKITRFFTRPISATRLAVCQLTLGMATVAAMYVAPAALLNVGGAQWPLIGPALFLAAALACACAAIWTFEGTLLGQIVACSATTVLLAIWFSRRYGATVIGDWDTMWLAPTAGEMLSLAAIIAGAYAASIAAVRRTRRGDVWNFSALEAWWERQLARRSAVVRLRGPLTAQLWCEWRQKLSAAPACLVACFLLVMVALRVAGFVETQPMLEMMAVAPIVMLTIVFPMLFGLMFGNCSRGSQWNSSMPHVLATRPISDALLGTALLRNAAKAFVLVWGTWFSGVALTAAALYVLGFREPVLRALVPNNLDQWDGVLPLVIVPLVYWTFTGLMMSLAATGRAWLYMAVLGSAFGLGIAVAVARSYLAEPAFDALALVWYVASGALATLGTGWAFATALRRRLVTPRAVALSAVLWLAAGLAGGLLVRQPPFYLHLVLLIHTLGLLALSFLPLAAVPLAVRWNRHR